MVWGYKTEKVQNEMPKVELGASKQKNGEQNW
jgi:hypothetical protein